MVPALMGLAPVSIFLAALVLLDSYKLVAPRLVAAVVVLGMAAAGVSYLVNDWLFGNLGIGFAAFTRYVSPVSEEILKAAVIVLLVRRHRIGFLVDAAILGFATGTGFSIIENLHYLRLVPDAGMGTWLARGFGTAIMHGGTTSLFAVIAVAALERSPRAGAALGLAIAVVVHSIYNHFFFSPLASMIGIAVTVPLLLAAVFSRSEAAVGNWLGKGFDADTEMLALLMSGELADSPIGRYLHELREKFHGPIVADLLCYLRLYTELALRAKGVLMMRESGFSVQIDEATRERFAELRYLEQSIGRTGLLAMQPLLHMSHKDLWQLYMIGK